MILIGILLCRFLSDLGPKWSGKALNEVIMGGNYSQTLYGDFWTDSGTNLFFEKPTKITRTPRSGQTIFSKIGKP